MHANQMMAKRMKPFPQARGPITKSVHYNKNQMQQQQEQQRQQLANNCKKCIKRTQGVCVIYN